MSKFNSSAVCTRYDCFAFDNGGCAVLTENCKGVCSFFKTREQFELDRERTAHRVEEYEEKKCRSTEFCRGRVIKC